MTSRLKEDEKNEKIIRGLLKQPANRKCINCGSLGPQYVCTTFSTFVCTTCSGIHREFTHRVKSVSMAKFTPEEVSALQAGGNEPAKQIYFKEWDPQRHSAPDSSNVDRLRDFIKHAYVDRRYTGERNIDRPSRLKTGDREEAYDNRRTDGYQSGSRSPPYDDTYERRYSYRSSPGYDGGRSPGNDQDHQRHSDYGRSPARSGILNDWRREDRFANGRRSDDHVSSDGDSKTECRSPEHQKDLNMSSPPIVRPVRDILGENVIPLRISEPSRVNSGRAADVSVHPQRTASSSSLASNNGNPVELIRETSLIDFDADPEPPVTATPAQTQLSLVNQSISNVTSAPSNDNWAHFGNAPDSKVYQAPANVNSPEFLLTQLSALSSAPDTAPGLPSGGSALPPVPANVASPSTIIGDSLFTTLGHTMMKPNSVAAPATLPVGNSESFHAGGAPTAPPGLTSMLPVNSGIAQWNGMQQQQQQQTLFLNSASVPAAPRFTSFPNSPGPSGNPVAQASQTVIGPVQASPEVAAKPAEVKSGGRKELPEDLFTAKYPSMHASAQGWQAGLAPGMGFPMQYNTAVFMPTFPQSTKSINPFDVGGEASPAQVAVFPSMTSLQAALLNVAPSSGLVHTSSLGTAVPSLMPSQPSVYPSTVPPLSPSLSTIMAPGAFMGQQTFALGGMGSEETYFGSLNPNLSGKFSAPPMPSPSVSGNPFG
ncbi:hypothetical protein Ancab_006967 [Ancistrocladus abbreviatus]